MRSCSLLIFLSLLSGRGSGQNPSTPRVGKSMVYSASSEWQKVSFKATPRLPAKPTVSRPSAQPEAARPTTVAPPIQQPPDAPVPAVTQLATPRPGMPPPDVARPDVARPDVARPDVARPEAVRPDPVRPTTRTSMARLNTPQPEVVQPDARSSASVVPPADRVSPGRPGESATGTRPSNSGYRPAFTGDFVTNRNGWKSGNKGDYNYQIGLGKYNIRKRNRNTPEVAFSYVPLPSEINLNIAETFTIKVDVVADSGRVPTGGLLFGVRDSLNFCAFTANANGEISIIRVANGQTFSDYMPGDFFAPGVPVDRNRNRLIIRRNGDALHFYINEREVRSSPYPFKLFAGNNVGLITAGYWTSFQKLSVILGL